MPDGTYLSRNFATLGPSSLTASREEGIDWQIPWHVLEWRLGSYLSWLLKLGLCGWLVSPINFSRLICQAVTSKHYFHPFLTLANGCQWGVEWDSLIRETANSKDKIISNRIHDWNRNKQWEEWDEIRKNDFPLAIQPAETRKPADRQIELMTAL